MGETPGQKILRAEGYHRFTAHLPERLVETFDQQIKDPNLLALDGHIALLDTRLTELLEQLDSDGGSGALFKELAKLKADFLSYQAALDKEAMAETLNELFSVIDRGATDQATWTQIQSIALDSKALRESERRYRQEQKMLIPMADVIGIFAALMGLLKEHIQDPLAREPLVRDIERYILQRWASAMLPPEQEAAGAS